MSGSRRIGSQQNHHSAGFTIVEVLVVIGVIAVLAGILLPALAGVRKTGLMTKSMSNMKQISSWMRMYSTDNRDQILPSQFDYTNNPNPGKVRSTDVVTGDKHKGTWTDILWAQYEIAVFPVAGNPTAPDYRFDSPDRALYDTLGDISVNVLRSAANNSRPTPGTVFTDLPKPYGPGGDNTGEAGYFAANDFFNAVPNLAGESNWYTNGQIKSPDRSMYLVDSVAGEVIDDVDEPYDNTSTNPSVTKLEVDFRYPGSTCLMLFLDGHISPEGEWEDLCTLERSRSIRVQALTQRDSPCP